MKFYIRITYKLVLDFDHLVWLLSGVSLSRYNVSNTGLPDLIIFGKNLIKEEIGNIQSVWHTKPICQTSLYLCILHLKR